MQFPWYYHVAANAYQHRKKISTASKLYATARTYKMLRGYRKKTSSVVPYYRGRYATENQLRMLASQVAKNKEETKYFRKADVAFSVPSSANWQRFNYDVVETLIADGSFRENVLGDKFKNLTLKLRGYGTAQMFRIIVYKARNADRDMSTPLIGVTNDETYFPEPSDFIVYSDKTWTTETTKANESFNYTVKLNFQTIFDSDNLDIVRQGNLKILITAYNGLTTNKTIQFGYELAYTNK